MKHIKKLIIAIIAATNTTLPLTAYAATDVNSVQAFSADNYLNSDFKQNNDNNLVLNENLINNAAFKKEESKINADKNLKGWKTTDDAKYYYMDDNTKAKGWTEIDDKWYFFDSDGKLLTGWISNGNDWYYSDVDGVRMTGWITDNNKKYYLSEYGVRAKGMQKIGDNTYLFSNNGEMLTGWKLLSDNNWYYFNSDGTMKTGWMLNNNFKYYLKDNGAMAVGWTTIEDKDYYFNKDGALRSGWTGIGKDIYYLDNTGAKVINSVIDGYTLDEQGKLVLEQNETEPDIDKYFTNKNISINTDECEYKSKNKGIQESSFKGIDISNHNGYIDFNAVKNAGVKVVYMKASESDYFIDQYAAENCKNAKAAGLKVGFYHYLTGTSSPEAQARLFYECIKDKPNDLKPCVDVEVSPSTASDYTIRFINEFKKYSNMDICIYTYTNFIDNFDSSLSSYSLWEANYNDSPFTLPGNSVWNSKAGHQYTDKGYISGVGGNIDFDIFNHDILL